LVSKRKKRQEEESKRRNREKNCKKELTEKNMPKREAQKKGPDRKDAKGHYRAGGGAKEGRKMTTQGRNHQVDCK